MNNKGFTLIELMAAIILLAVVMSITTVSVVSVLQNSKQKSYELLLSDIKIGAQGYFEECENTGIMKETLPDDACKDLTTNKNLITNACDNDVTMVENVSCSDTKISEFKMNLSSLVKYGFLKTSSVETDSEGIKKIENPVTNNGMNDCQIKVLKFVNMNNYSTWYKIISLNDSGIEDCPTTGEIK